MRITAESICCTRITSSGIVVDKPFVLEKSINDSRTPSSMHPMGWCRPACARELWCGRHAHIHTPLTSCGRTQARRRDTARKCRAPSCRFRWSTHSRPDSTRLLRSVFRDFPRSVAALSLPPTPPSRSVPCVCCVPYEQIQRCHSGPHQHSLATHRIAITCTTANVYRIDAATWLAARVGVTHTLMPHINR